MHRCGLARVRKRSASSFTRRNRASAAGCRREAEENQSQPSVRRYAGRFPRCRNSPSSAADISRPFLSRRAWIDEAPEPLPDPLETVFFAGDDVSNTAKTDGATFATTRGGFGGGSLGDRGCGGGPSPAEGLARKQRAWEPPARKGRSSAKQFPTSPDDEFPGTSSAPG